MKTLTFCALYIASFSILHGQSIFSVYQWLTPGTNLYYYTVDPKGPDTLKIYSTVEKIRIKNAKENDGRVTFKMFPSDSSLAVDSSLSLAKCILYDPHDDAFLKKTYFFDQREYFLPNKCVEQLPIPCMCSTTENDKIWTNDYHFSYKERRVVLQPLTIPLKFRPKLNETSYKDTFQLTTETGINLSIAGGFKWTRYNYTPTKSYLESYFNKTITSAGIFLGFSAVDINSNTTRNPQFTYSRKAPTVSPGIYYAVGFNSIFAGISGGVDFATGNGSAQWIYQGKPWLGIVFGFNIIN